MAITKITNLEFGKMVQAAANKLQQNAEFINSLNVFPVPDGDTGTNMSMSMNSGAKYERENTSQNVGDLAGSLAKGLLMGARGNSGVILSQIFRGFANAAQDKKELTAQDFVDAYANGAQTAYKAVMKPTEGTILTVVRESAQAGIDTVKSTNDVVTVLQAICDAADQALKKTPDLLPVLKEVGVVDSGGQGLVYVLHAFLDALTGKASGEMKPDNAQMDEMINAKHHQSAQGKLDPADIKYGYCTQMMVRLGRGKQVTQKFDYDTFYNYLAKLGDSLLVINDDEVVKVHVHTEHPGKVLSWGQQFGDLQTVKVDNMRWQQEQIMDEDEENAEADEESAHVKESAQQEAKTPQQVETAVIAVAAGKGLSELLKSLGVTHVINGGQTMNPSIQDIADAINQSGARNAIVLPDNGNIIMAADQAKKIAEIPTAVVKTKSIPQAMSALLEFNPDNTLEENQSAMEDALDTVKSGSVTVAVRDTTVNGMSIKKDDYIGIVDGDIVATDADVQTTAEEMVKQMLDEDSSVVTIYYGEDGNEKVADHLQSVIEGMDDELDVQVYEGDQPVYPYLISVE